MSPVVIGLIGLLIFIVLISLRMPVAFGMLLVGFLGYSYVISPSAAFNIVAQDFFSTFASYSLATVPMFIFMGFIAHQSGVGANIYNLANKLIGHITGGLLLATQLACAIFGAICGSLLATVATMGSVAIPQTKKLNYDMSISTASIVAGSSLGSLIPPSIILIVYGIAAEQSIGRLFLAGVLPGIVHMCIYMITIVLLTWYKPSLAMPGPKANWVEKVHAFRGGVFEVFIVFIITLGGLFIGWFTPTEAGAVGATSLFIVTVLRKKMDWRKTIAALRSTTKLTAQIFLLVGGATVFGRFIAITRIPFEFASFAQTTDLPNFVVFLLIIAMSFLLGMFIDTLALILLIIPVFFPVITSLGYDPIWFGIVIVVIASMGCVTPPVGMGVYVIKGVVPEVKLETVFKGMWPFILADWAFIVLLLLFPVIATFLPDLLL
ncbi:MAG: TRAP transporter large permease [Desulfobacteraceae bacterium]|nr:TRAP transporter large permease [Desulfobacteraceae bacterium]